MMALRANHTNYPRPLLTGRSGERTSRRAGEADIKNKTNAEVPEIIHFAGNSRREVLYE